jgi:hypothetical protein
MSAGHRIAGRSGAILTGLLWVIVGGDLGLQANQPNVELPVNACVAWAIAASLGGRSRSAGKSAVMTGALAACGILLKPVAAAPLGFLAAADAAERWRKGGWRAAVAFLGCWGALMSCGVALVMTWSVFVAGSHAVWDALIRYNLGYQKGTLLANLQEMARIGAHLPTSSLVTIGFLAAAGVPGLIKMKAPERRRILTVILGSMIAVAAPGKFFPHYYQLLLPPLVVAAAIGFTKLLDHPGVQRFIAIAGLATLGYLQFQSLLLPPDEWSRRKYGDVFLDEVRLADCLKKYVKPGDSFWQLAPQPGLYLLTETVPASGVIYDNPLRRRSPVRQRLTERVIADLTEHPPTKVLVQSDPSRNVDSRIGMWIQQNYRVVKDGSLVDGYQLWTLRGQIPGDGQSPLVPCELPILVDGFDTGTTEAWPDLPPDPEKRPIP